MTSPAILDASAILCVLQQERGAENVEAVLVNAVVSTVNASEVIAKLRDIGLCEVEADQAFALLSLDVRPFTPAQGRIAGHLRAVTRSSGLSLGDRSCLALAIELKGIAFTTERVWAALDIPDLEIRQVR